MGQVGWKNIPNPRQQEVVTKETCHPVCSHLSGQVDVEELSLWACDEVSGVAEVVGALALEALPARRTNPDLTRAPAVHLLRYKGGLSLITYTQYGQYGTHQKS